MRATLIHGPRDIRVQDVPDPTVQRPGDAVVKVVAACVCGSDLWPYRGTRTPKSPQRIGHEFVGVVEAVGDEVSTVVPGDFVVAPFALSCGTCRHCLNGITTSCERGLSWGSPDADGLMVDGAQGEYVRVPLADGTLVATPQVPDDAMVPHLLAMSDVMVTGHHAAVIGGVGKGSTVVVVGDGAVGLSAVLAGSRLGAERIIIMSRHEDRQRLARTFGATDVVAERGAEGVAAVKELLGGIGADSVLECVGTKESMEQSLETTRPGGRVGFVGVPAGGPELPAGTLFRHNLTVAGGVAPVRAYLDELLPEVVAGMLSPGAVFDLELPLEQAAEAYAAMDERRAIKVLLRP